MKKNVSKVFFIAFLLIFNLSSLSAGVYIVKVNNTEVGKFIKK